MCWKLPFAPLDYDMKRLLLFCFFCFFKINEAVSPKTKIQRRGIPPWNSIFHNNKQSRAKIFCLGNCKCHTLILLELTHVHEWKTATVQSRLKFSGEKKKMACQILHKFTNYFMDLKKKTGPLVFFLFLFCVLFGFRPQMRDAFKPRDVAKMLCFDFSNKAHG